VLPETVAAGHVLDIVRECGGDIIEKSTVFDVFSGGSLERGHKSLGVRLTFRSAERTLQDAEVDAVIQSIVKIAADRVQARVRGVNVESSKQGEMLS
jgi:phenylalanyl-tRNA synthetase beta chain